MTDIPDLRTLAEMWKHYGRRVGRWVSDGWQARCQCGWESAPMGTRDAADAEHCGHMAAAVLPVHRRQVLEEAADACSAREDEANWAYCRDLAFGPGTPSVRESAARARTWRAAKELLQELVSAAPEAAPSPRQDDETAPAVPEATPERADVVLPDGTHLYWSTHCRHDRHDACSAAELAPGVPRNPAQCKTCAAPCRCACHVYVDDAASAYRAGQAAAPDDEDVVTL